MKYVTVAVAALFAFILGMTAVGLGFADDDAPRTRPQPVYLDAETRDVLPPTVLRPKPDSGDDSDDRDDDRDDDGEHSPEVVVPHPQPAQGDDDDSPEQDDADDYRDDRDDRGGGDDGDDRRDRDDSDDSDDRDDSDDGSRDD